MLIALLLTGMLILPLSQLPLRAAQEQLKNNYRSQTQRLANEGLAHLKEMLYQNHPSWNDLSKAPKEGIVVFEDLCSPALPQLNKSFKRRGVLKCVRKKTRGTEEWWLVLARIDLSPEDASFSLFKKGKKERNVKSFAHYLVLYKTSSSQQRTS